MHKVTSSIAMLILIALFASACGGGSDSVESDNTSTDAAATDTTEVAQTSEPQTTQAATPTTTTAETTTTVDPGPIVPPVPEPTFDEYDLADNGSIACVGTRVGLSCLTSGNEWTNYTRDNSPISSWVQSIDICDDGRVVVPSLKGVAVLDNGVWAESTADFVNSSPKAVACRDGVIWATWFEHVGFLANGQWTDFDNEDVLGEGEYVSQAEGVAIAPDGSAWIISADSVARYLAGEWTVWEKGTGLDVAISPDAIDIAEADDGTFTVWIADSKQGFGSYDGNEWVFVKESMNGSDAITASGGTVYVPAYNKGMSRLDQGLISALGTDVGLSSNDVSDVHLDAAGNLWAATSYGLTILIDGQARTYRVDNSAILDNDVTAVAVHGRGPQLPADAPEEWSGFSGILLDDFGMPITDASIEVCVETLFGEFDGDTPCAEDPYSATVVTGEDGRFELLGLRAGRYVLFMQINDSWTKFKGPVADRYDALSGEIVNLGVFSVSDE